MGFAPITIDEFVKKQIKNDPTENENDLKRRLIDALSDYKNGVKCDCGNDIWVIGSAYTGNSCFTCITGERNPSDDYEIDKAIKKSQNITGRRHIDKMDPTQIAGFFDDDGYEINADLIKKPNLCLTCIKDSDPSEELLCNMNRFDQKDEEDFKCFAYERIK